jgi:hypothetical protein
MSDFKRFIKRLAVDYDSVRPNNVNYHLCHQSVGSVPYYTALPGSSQFSINFITKKKSAFYAIFYYWTIGSKLNFFINSVSLKYRTG